MVSRFFEAIGEVLAPPVRNPLEDFKTHWKHISHFYIDQREDVDEAKIVYHLNRMVEILLEEEDFTDNHKRGTGPCLEFFLQEKILEIWCGIGERDLPRGVRREILVVVATLLRNMTAPLLYHMSVHRPVCQLITACRAVPEIERSEFVSLLHTLLIKLKKEDPTLVTFFFNEPDTNGSTSEEPQPDFVIFSALLPYFGCEGADGERARIAILFCLEFCSSPEVIAYVRKSNLPFLMAAALVALYRGLPHVTSSLGAKPMVKPADKAKAKELRREAKEKALDVFLRQLQFVSNLAKVSPSDISSLIVQSFENDFLTPVLGPSLLQPSEAGANAATGYVRAMLAVMDPPLLHSFIAFLLGDSPGPETESEENDHLLRSTLIRRIDSLSEEVSLATLKLFETLVTLRDEYAMSNLILRNLHLNPHLPPSLVHNAALFSPARADDSAAEAENIRNSVSAFLQLFPVCDSPSDGYEEYLADAQKSLLTCMAACSKWKTQYNNPTQIPAARTESRFYEGLFMNVLFNKIERLLEHSLDSNLLATSIVTHLTHFPHPLLRAFLLHPSPLTSTSSPAPIRALHSVLKRVSDEARLKCKHIPNYRESMQRLRDELYNDASTSDDGATSPTGGLDDGGDRRRLLENLLVLEEFCKELAATLQAFFIIHYYEPQPQEFSTRSPSPSLPGGHVPGKGH